MLNLRNSVKIPKIAADVVYDNKKCISVIKKSAKI